MTKQRHSIKQDKESLDGTARLFIIKNNIREFTARHLSKHAVFVTDQGYTSIRRIHPHLLRSHAAIDHTRTTHQEHFVF